MNNTPASSHSILSSRPSLRVGRVFTSTEANQHSWLLGQVMFAAFGLLCIVRWEPAPVDIVMPLLAAGCILNIGTGNRPLRLNRLLFAVSLVIVIVQALTILRSGDPNLSLRYWAITVFMVILCLLGYCVGQRTSLIQTALSGFVLISSLTFVISLLGYFALLPDANIARIVADSGVRLEGFFKNPNALGAFSVTLLVVLVDAVLNQSHGSVLKLPRWIFYVGLVACVFAIFLSFSRSAWGASVLSIAVLLLLSSTGNVRLSRPKQMMIPSAVVFSVSVAAYFFFPPETWSYMEAKLSEDLADNPRFAYQAEALSLVWEYPVIGHGPATSAYDMGLGPHNVYIMQAYDHGLLGLLLLVFIWISALLIAIRYALSSQDKFVKRLAAIYAAVLIGNIAIGFLMDLLHLRQLWLFVGLGWSLPLLESVRAAGRNNGEVHGNRSSWAN